VLIRGETGTGKELVAQALHDLSGRKGPLVALNCGGLPDNLLDSELFGHEAGAFTGAAKRRIGKIEHAHHGTLFLDELESMPMGVQIKLLRVLQDRVVERLGSNAQVAVDCRVVAATKDDLLQRRRTAASAATCTTASTSSPSTCRPCANGARTSPCCWSTFCCWPPAATACPSRW
jgi:two-component system C4-dicarboxylate transport response regulator DctD